LIALRAGAQSFDYDHAGRVILARYDTGATVTYRYILDGSLTNVAVSGTITEEDSDGDSMPDAWEWVYFNILTNAAAGDPNRNGRDNLWEFQNGYDPLDPDSDGDHAFNWDEIGAGTDPFSATSVFQVSDLRSPVSGPVVEWSSITNKHYRIQRSAQLPDGFGNLRTNILATPPLNVHTDSTAAGSGPWLYRIELE
jgi:YD repeat-containing protein